MEAQTSPLPRISIETEDSAQELLLADAQDGAVLTLGTAADNDLVFGGDFASRKHAFIEVYRRDFYLVDTSTNGTFVQTEDERVAFVHRDRIRLWGVGWIALGDPLHKQRPLMFREQLGV